MKILFCILIISKTPMVWPLEFHISTGDLNFQWISNGDLWESAMILEPGLSYTFEFNIIFLLFYNERVF